MEEHHHDHYPKYKGVRKRKWGKWVSEIRLPNSRERIWLGSYDAAEKAARAFDAAQFCLRGPHAHFNFPESPPDIAGGRSLSPQQIQVVAARFANNPSCYDGPPEESGEPSRRGSSSEDATTTTTTTTTAAPGDGFSDMDWSLLNFLDYSDNNHRGSSGGYYDDFDPDRIIQYSGDDNNNIITSTTIDEDYYSFSTSHYDSHSSYLWNF